MVQPLYLLVVRVQLELVILLAVDQVVLQDLIQNQVHITQVGMEVVDMVRTKERLFLKIVDCMVLDQVVVDLGMMLVLPVVLVLLQLNIKLVRQVYQHKQQAVSYHMIKLLRDIFIHLHIQGYLLIQVL